MILDIITQDCCCHLNHLIIIIKIYTTIKTIRLSVTEVVDGWLGMVEKSRPEL